MDETSAGVTIEMTLMASDVDPPIKGWLVRQLRKIVRLAGIERAMIHVAVVGDEAMTDLHERYKSQPGTTDVLTFDLRDAGTTAVEGEIVICVDEAARQAASRGRDARLEVLLYAVHGLLHLAGYDDATASQARQMHHREDELLSLAGFGPLYG